MKKPGVTRFGLPLVLVCSFLLAACGGATPEATELPPEAEMPTAIEEEAPPPQEEATQPQAATEGGEISENIATQVVAQSYPDLDPDLMLTEDHSLGFQMYETLTFWDPDKGVLPKLATSWESNEDATEWTYHLRQGVTFHDGTPFTAEAVKFSYERTLEVGLMAYYFDTLEEIEIIDDYTVKLKYSSPRPSPTLLAAGYGMFIVNPNLAEKPDGWLEEGNDAGTGPYMIVDYEPGARFVLERYPDYWGGWEEGQFTKLVYVIVEDPTVREQMIRSGEADLTMSLPFDVHEGLEATGEITVNNAPQFWNIFLQWQLDKPPMDNLKFRQALAYAFPYETVQKALYGGMGTISAGIVPKGLWQSPVQLETPTHDLEKAAALLQESGVGQGVEIRVATDAGDVEGNQIALLYQAELAKIGVTLNIEEITVAAWWDNAYNPDNEFDGMFNYWAPGWPSPYEFAILYHSANTFTPYTAYDNAAYNALLEQALAAEATDMQEATRLYAESQQMLYDEAVAVFILDVPIDFVYRNDIVGFVPNPNYFDVVFWYDMKRQ